MVLSGCGGSATTTDAHVTTTSLAGVWQTTLGGVAITVTFSGETSGAVETVQSTTGPDGVPACRLDLVGTGTFVVSGSSVTLTTPSGVQHVHGCPTTPDSETPLSDPMPLMSFAAALSGPFVLTETTLQLGSSYPILTRLTR